MSALRMTWLLLEKYSDRLEVQIGRLGEVHVNQRIHQADPLLPQFHLMPESIVPSQMSCVFQPGVDLGNPVLEIDDCLDGAAIEYSIVRLPGIESLFEEGVAIHRRTKLGGRIERGRRDQVASHHSDHQGSGSDEPRYTGPTLPAMPTFEGESLSDSRKLAAGGGEFGECSQPRGALVQSIEFPPAVIAADNMSMGYRRA
jgi:hypothetical protein